MGTSHLRSSFSVDGLRQEKEVEGGGETYYLWTWEERGPQPVKVLVSKPHARIILFEITFGFISYRIRRTRLLNSSVDGSAPIGPRGVMGCPVTQGELIFSRIE